MNSTCKYLHVYLYDKGITSYLYDGGITSYLYDGGAAYLPFTEQVKKHCTVQLGVAVI